MQISIRAMCVYWKKSRVFTTAAMNGQQKYSCRRTRKGNWPREAVKLKWTEEKSYWVLKCGRKTRVLKAQLVYMFLASGIDTKEIIHAFHHKSLLHCKSVENHECSLQFSYSLFSQLHSAANVLSPPAAQCIIYPRAVDEIPVRGRSIEELLRNWLNGSDACSERVIAAFYTDWCGFARVL